MIKKEAQFRGAYNLENFRFVFRALKHRNYRLFFGGQIISLSGTWMQGIALSWLVYRLTNSALLLGVVGFVSQIPSLLCTPFAGVVADRHNRHRILLLTQTLSLLQATVLTILVFTNKIAVSHIIALGVFIVLSEFKLGHFLRLSLRTP